MKRFLPSLLAFLGVAAAPGFAQAGVIFADNFDDGVVSDWSVSSNYPGLSEIAVRNDISVSPDYALWVSLFAPPGGVDLWTRASHSFSVGTPGDVTLSLSAISSPCQGCVISYEVLLDGNMLASSAWTGAFDSLSFNLTGISAGSHDLSLGVRTTNASSGRFSATFDNVVISDTQPEAPEPATWLLAAGGAAIVLLRRRFNR